METLPNQLAHALIWTDGEPHTHFENADRRDLSERLRPGVECAPWVIEEVRAVERALAATRRELQEARARERRLLNTLAASGTDPNGAQAPNQSTEETPC